MSWSQSREFWISILLETKREPTYFAKYLVSPMVAIQTPLRYQSFGHTLVLVVPNFGRICICYEPNSPLVCNLVCKAVID